MASPRKQYVALLRAINVGGRVIKMDVLRRHFESLGLQDVSTYIQTGNVIFSTPSAGAKRLTQDIETHIEKQLGYLSMVFLRTHKDLVHALDAYPFPEELNGEKYQRHIMFLSDAPDASHRKALSALRGDEYDLHTESKLLFFAYPKSVAGHRRNINFEKVLGVSGTARTVQVVQKLADLTA